MKKRDVGLDITRIFAFFSVVCIHSLLYTGFYETPVAGKRMYLLIMLRGIFNTCIPLFLMLSGWLLSGRVIDLEPKGSLRRYVSGCKGLVCTYLLSGCALLLFMRGFLRMPLPFREAAAYILRYDEYAWYVNMYLGLYLLMPFLNTLWRGLSGKSARKKCVLCLLILTALPGLANVYDLRTPGVLLQPWNYTGQTQLVPNWWTALYPVTFYFLGAYLREHGNVRQMHTGKTLLVLLLSIIVCGAYNIWRSWNGSFVRSLWNCEGSWQTILCGVPVFLCINSIRFPEPGKQLGRLLGLLSELTFSAYLLSWASDQAVYQALYPRLLSAFGVLARPISIAASAALALLGAFLIRLVQKMLFALLRGIRKAPANV